MNNAYLMIDSQICFLIVAGSPSDRCFFEKPGTKNTNGRPANLGMKGSH